MSTTSTISIQANGESFDIETGTTLPAFVEARGLHPQRVVVERNGAALTQTEAQATTLEAGDKLEIVRIVAGG